MEHELISVIVPVYNVVDYIQKCLDSILAQSYSPIEVILVDDGSTDRSGALCDVYAGRFPNVRVIHTENHGLSAARNTGLREARGMYIGFVDSDDWIEPEMYDVLFDDLTEAGAEISCVGVKQDYGDGASTLRKTSEATVCSGKDFLTAIMENSRVYGYVCNKLFRRETLCDLKFKEALRSCEDLDFTVRYVTKCRKGVYTESELYHYRQRGTSMTGELGYNARKLSVLDAYEAIMPIYEAYCPECMYILRRNYLKININILGRMRRSRCHDEAVHKRLTENVERTYLEVMNDPHNSKAVQFNIWMSKHFPGFSLWAKQTALKKYRKRFSETHNEG